MPTQLQFRRGTTSQNDNFTGAGGELSIDTTLDQLRIHDGSTAGGFKVARDADLLTKMSVANTQSLHTSITANLNAYIANTNPRITNLVTEDNNLWSGITGTNTALRTLISDRMQVANAQSLYSNVTANLNSYIANTNTWNLRTDSNLTATNTALRTLISDRMQVANAQALFDTLQANLVSTTNVQNYMAVSNTQSLVNARLGATASVTLTGDATGSGSFSSNSVSISTTLADSGVSAGAYGSASAVPVITVDAKGRVTSLSTSTVAGVTDMAFTTANNNLRVSVADGTTYDVTITTSDKLQVANATFQNVTAYGNTTTREIQVGGLNVAGAFTLPKTDGEEDQVLTTDGSGTVVWAAAGAGTGFILGTLTTYPGSEENFDYFTGGSQSETYIGSTGASGSDAFGVSLDAVYDCNDPKGRFADEVDFGSVA